MLIALVLCAFFTSLLSGMAGMAGGVLLLSCMTFFLDLRAIVPLHGIVQMVSNSSRCWYLKRHIRWDFVKPFLVGAPVGFMVAYFVLSSLSQTHYFFLLLAGLIFWALFKPKTLPALKLKHRQWAVLGALAGLQGALIGATGPLLAIFFLRDDLSKEQIVATKAMQQFIVHTFKIPLFVSLQFSYSIHLEIIWGMTFATVAGSFVGVKILKRVQEKTFQYLFKTLLFLAGIRMLYKFFEVYFE